MSNWTFRIVTILLAGLCSWWMPHSLLAQESGEDQDQKDRKGSKEEPLEDELDELKEDDYPDLVGKEEEGTIIDEIDELKEDDYPDLVGVDESGAIMDEFAFLASEASYVESSARHRQDIGMSPSAITVITREDIETSGASTFPDLLRTVPGMDVVIMSPTFASVTARLFWTNENNHFLVLIDGRDVIIELVGQPFWEIQPISMEDVERIEIIRGPGSALYGANALAGVISITTRSTPQRTSGWARIAMGEIGNMVLGTRGNLRVGKWGFSLSGGGSISGMYENPRQTGKDIWKLRALAEYNWSEDRKISADFGLVYAQGLFDNPIGKLNFELVPMNLRLSYKSDDFFAQLYWYGMPAVHLDVKGVLEFNDTVFARFVPLTFALHTLDAEVQWTVPRFWDPLLLIVGGGPRVSYAHSDQILDADTFGDPSSPDYREPGSVFWETRVGAYVHGELKPVEWFTMTSDLRFDYNTTSGAFFSPRVAAVFRPADGQFVRLGLARAFRKPSGQETELHFLVDFPAGSPITGGDRDVFLEFMTRVVGNNRLENEELLSFEIGYRGQFLDDRLITTLDLYYNRYYNWIVVDSALEYTSQGVPDFERSSFMFDNVGPELTIFGGELTVRYNFSRSFYLQASWAHREVFEQQTGKTSANSPKNLLSLGGNYKSSGGFLGSLYMFTRSGFVASGITNPDGIMAPSLSREVEHEMLVMGKFGWKFAFPQGAELETGLMLFLPVSPFAPPYFHYREFGGGVTPDGRTYGSDQLRRVITAYLQGSF
jgi:iron complex outermembrane receptor protein